MTLAPGTVFAGFTIERTLGVGGMGTVYLARHPRLPRSDALKLLRRELSFDPDYVERFAREADIAAQLSHPNIVGVNDRGVEDGQLWISMPYIAGVDAEQALVECHGPMPAERAIRIVSQIAAALDFAHRNGLWHRDVKPANILLSPGLDDEPERVLLTDFGIAKAADDGRGLTKSGFVLGTFDYAPPEQIEGRPFDHRVDIYALGCVLYKLLTSSLPYPGTTMGTKLHGHLNLPPPRPTDRAPWLASGLDDVVAKAMAKDPDARYSSCRALASAALTAWSTTGPRLTVPYPAIPSDPESTAALTVGSRETDELSVGDQELPVRLPPPELPARFPPPELPARLPPSELPNGPPPEQPARVRLRLLGALAATALVLGAGITTFVLNRDDGEEPAQTPPVSTDADIGDGGQAELPSSADLGLPSGPPLADSLLVANQEIDGNLDLYAVDSASGEIQQRLTSDPALDFGPVIAPDRASVVYLNQREQATELWVVASDGTGARALFATTPAGCDSVRRPAWNPADPDMLALVCVDPAGAVTLHLVTTAGEAIRTLETGLPLFDDVAFSPDGTSLSYWGSTDSAAGDGPLYVLATDGDSPPAQLTDETWTRCADALWSPDGARIAFRAVVNDGAAPFNAEIVVMQSDGSDPQILAPGAGIDQDPAWSPDGDMIVFKSDRGTAAGDRVDRLWIMDEDGGNPRLLSAGDVLDGFAPAWANR